MMKIIVGLVSIVLVGVVSFTVFGSKFVNKPTTSPQQVQNQVLGQNQDIKPTAEVINPSGSYTINELFTMNRPMKCTWKESQNKESDVTNIIYLNGKKFYQDVTMGDLGHSYTISDGEYLYIWHDFNDAASKMKYSELESSVQPGQDKKGSAGLDQKHDFLCEGWMADESVFIPPQNKNFKDVTTEMQEAVQKINEGDLEKMKQQACEMCLKAPTKELQDDCLTNAECNE